MEFMDRGSRPAQSSSSPAAPAPTSGGRKKKTASMGLKVASVVLLFSATILVVALLWSVVLGAPTSEGKHVNKDKMQAVFLNGGQLYFGHINDINKEFMRVSDIYYLRANQQVQPDQADKPTTSSVKLVKLGCEPHGPEDSMVIRQAQVIFWENIKDDGQVGKLIAEFKKANPNGQKCAAAATSSSTPAATTPATTTPATTTQKTN